MSYGFTAVNDNNEVIISDLTNNYHFYNKYSPVLGQYSQEKIGDYDGPYAALDGVMFSYYDVYMPMDKPVITPLIFIKPTNNPDAYSAVYRTYIDPGNAFRIKVIVMTTGLHALVRRIRFVFDPNSGEYVEEYYYEVDTTQLPEIYCFLPADYVPPHDNSDYGLQVFREDGSTSFDSRKRPLSIIGGGEHEPPADPTNGSGYPGITTGHPWNYATNDHDFRSTTRKNSYTFYTSPEVEFTDIMYSACTIAQACWFREQQGYKKSCGGSWATDCQEHWSNARWWVMYRNACRVQAAPESGKFYFESGWGPVISGFAFDSRYESGGWFGGGGGSWETGSAPYEQKTLNLRPSLFLIADAKSYA